MYLYQTSQIAHLSAFRKFQINPIPTKVPTYILLLVLKIGSSYATDCTLIYPNIQIRISGYCIEMFQASKIKPLASEVLTCYLKQCNEPHWTSYFVRYKDVIDDQRGMSHFNWKVRKSNYHILRTGCFPFIKYHCSKCPHEDLTASNRLMYLIKICNLGIPALMYGIAAIFLVTHQETVITPQGNVRIYFLLRENKESKY